MDASAIKSLMFGSYITIKKQGIRHSSDLPLWGLQGRTPPECRLSGAEGPVPGSFGVGCPPPQPGEGAWCCVSSGQGEDPSHQPWGTEDGASHLCRQEGQLCQAEPCLLVKVLHEICVENSVHRGGDALEQPWPWRVKGEGAGSQVPSTCLILTPVWPRGGSSDWSGAPAQSPAGSMALTLTQPDGAQRQRRGSEMQRAATELPT